MATRGCHTLTFTCWVSFNLEEQISCSLDNTRVSVMRERWFDVLICIQQYTVAPARKITNLISKLFFYLFREREKGTCLINPSMSSATSGHSLHSPSVMRSSGVSVPRTVITTVLWWCRATTKYAASHLPWYTYGNQTLISLLNDKSAHWEPRKVTCSNN